MTVQNILKSALREMGADGLCNENCGCCFDDFMPCYGEPCQECTPARKITGADLTAEHKAEYGDDVEYVMEEI